MTPERAHWLLTHPLDRADGAPPKEYIDRFVQRDNALLTVVLAVDR